MRLGSVLLAYKYFNKIPYRYRGKNRKVNKPSLHDLLKMKMDFEREERNMLILRHPYLTPEQSSGHMKALRKEEALKGKKQETYTAKMIRLRYENFQKEITIAERLSHLRVTEGWD
ncbi:uncharacterized protein LOC105422841 [Pogonomyrmex barbatus]|uniref:Uncharacterized protein LOC105422841 n=1 Tax=Pogonomyrmex barbatus TaxID=144034 RepID=A0A6I9VV44_9HYME|nr:uncharacterized protein LOC105422841 [Pogonomyrmex barbatus]